MSHTRVLSAGAISMLLLFSFVGFASALTTTCVGVPTSAAITWTASTTGGVLPITYVWGNGATSSSQTVAAGVGTHTMTLQSTDASSTVATTSCAATIAQAAPTISSFTATPVSITAGQSATLSWMVQGASSTSINNGVGMVTGTSTSVSPTVTTVYTLSATNPGGTATANATVTVVATSTNTTLAQQIQALLNQIDGLKKQIAQLLAGAVTGGTATSTTPGCYGFWRDLKRGDKGDDVKELQQLLAHNDPTLFPPGLVNGLFGPKTESALKMLQRRFGIDAAGTGFFGPKSRSHWAAMCSDKDADKDGIKNSDDADDDNDGTEDMHDRFPFNPHASSTPARMDSKKMKEKEDRGRGRGHND